VKRLALGLAAGLVGTSWMTAYQELVAKLQGGSGGGDGGDPWESAPAPAKVARKLLGVVGVEAKPDWIPVLTNVMHWGYGTTWGAAYGLVAGDRRAAFRDGALLGAGVWAASYAQLVPMGIYEPPWEYPPTTLATDLSYHLVYGVGVAAAYDALA
jgi:hypothetical protein